MRPPLSRGVGVFLAGVLASANLCAQVPTEVQLPGTQPGQIPMLDTAPSCTVCHGNYDASVEPWHNWSGSMMAHAARDPVFWATLAIAEQDYPGTGDFCIRCHTPTGWLDGRSTPTNGSNLNAYADADGVTCATCHKLTNPDQSEWQGAQSAPFLAYLFQGGAKQGLRGSGMYVMWNGYDMFGPYLDPPAYHLAQQSQFHRTPELCATCHDVSNPVTGDLSPNNGALTPLAPGTFNGQPGGPVTTKAAFNNPPHKYGVAERTYSEHQSSAFGDMPMSAYPSLPAELRRGALADAYAAATAVDPSGNYEDGALRTMSCQSCHMPPVTGYGDALGVGPLRKDLPKHSLVGGNYWAPEAIQWLDGQNKLVIGGGIAPDQVAGMVAGAERARENLESAAALDLDGPGDTTLEIYNLTGHKLPTGYPEGRRMWLHTSWYDVYGNLLREDGRYGDLAVQVGGQAVTVRTLLDPDDSHSRVYEARPGIGQAFAAKLLTLGTSATLPVEYDRVTGQVAATLADVANAAVGTSRETFHFSLNDTMTADNRIPPYGFLRDEALERNAVPIPDSQYGNPGPGGTYRCYDRITLQPPAEAAFAQIELLYQPTSWEYIQFLLLGNSGQDPFLANTGKDLYDAWRATGMAEPHVMATAAWQSTSFPYLDLGNGLTGLAGTPRLSGVGPLAARKPLALRLENGVPNGTAHLVVGFSELATPFYGGVLVPQPDLVIPGLPLDSAGGITLNAMWPAGIAHGFTFTAQAIVPDAAAIQGLALSNALRATAP